LQSALLLALLSFGSASAQTVTAAKTEILVGQSLELTWTHPPTAGVGQEHWGLCVVQITTEQMKTGKLPPLRSCSVEDYQDTTDGSSTYSFLKRSIGPHAYRYYAAVVVDDQFFKSVPFDKFLFTVRHEVIPYQPGLIRLPEGRKYAANQDIPVEITASKDSISAIETGKDDRGYPIGVSRHTIGIYRLPAKLDNGVISLGGYVGEVGVEDQAMSINFSTDLARAHRRVRRGFYELHYIYDDWVLDRQRIEIERLTPEMPGAFRIKNIEPTKLSVEADRQIVELIGGSARYILFALSDKTKTQIATAPVRIGYGDQVIDHQFTIGTYRLQMVVAGEVVMTEDFVVSAEDLKSAERKRALPRPPVANLRTLFVDVGPASPKGSLVHIKAHGQARPVDFDERRELVLYRGKTFQIHNGTTEPIGRWPLHTGETIEQEILLTPGFYVASIEGLQRNPYGVNQRISLFENELEVELAFSQGHIKIELDEGRVYAPRGRITGELGIVGLDDELTSQGRFFVALENPNLTYPVCERYAYDERLTRVGSDLDFSLDAPGIPGSYVLRSYYRPKGSNAARGAKYVLGSEQTIQVKVPNAKVELTSADPLEANRPAHATIARGERLPGEVPRGFGFSFETDGYVAPGGGIKYPGLRSRNAGFSDRSFRNDLQLKESVEGSRITTAAAAHAVLSYRGFLLDSVPFTVFDPLYPELPSLIIQKLGETPRHDRPTVPYQPLAPPDLPIVCPGHDERLVTVPDKPEETHEPEYRATPFLGLEAAVYPRKPVPGQPATLVFRIENTSQYSAGEVSVELGLLDPKTEANVAGLAPADNFCKEQVGGLFKCSLGDMNPGDVGDLIFHGETPSTGAVIWSAKLMSAGDLGGMVERGGVLGSRAPPKILDVVVIADQSRVEDEVASYPYPYGPNSRGTQSRYLLVVGHNLPQRPADNLELTDTDVVNYGFLAYPDTENAFYQEWFAKGWMQFYAMEDAAAAIAKGRVDGFDAILIRADLKEGILPGQKTVSANGSEGHWTLEFGDISAQLSFVRVLEDGHIDRLNSAYAPGRIHLAIETNMQLPLDEIAVLINPEELGAGQNAEIAMTAKRSELGDGRLYLTGPLDLHPLGRSASLTGGTAIPVRIGGDHTGVLQARVDESFATTDVLIPMTPVVASVTVSHTPATGDYSWLWKDGLNRAAACNSDVTVEDWSLLTQAESDEIWNLVVLTFSDHFPGQSVTFGHHAAAIMLRDMFLSVSERQVRKLRWISENNLAAKGFVGYMRQRASDDGLPLLRIQVTDFAGGKTPYRYVVLNDTQWLAELYGTTVDAIEAWQLRETQTALKALARAAENAIEDAKEAGDCDIEELIRMTGFSFEGMGDMLKAEMVTLAEVGEAAGRSLLWTPDNAARYWIDQVAPLAAAVREQQRLANIDTDLTLAAVAFMTMPLALSENAVVGLVAFAIDLTDLAVTSVHELSQYFASEEELRFAMGASIVIGVDRHKEALAMAKGWASTSFGIGTSLFGVITGSLDVLPKLAVLRRVARGRQVTRSLASAADIPALRPVDAQDFGAFAMSSYARSQSGGAQALTSLEQRAVGLVDEYRHMHPALNAVREADVPPLQTIDGFEPHVPVRFDMDAETKVATARAPPKGRINSPKFSGEIPNANVISGLENSNLTFRTPDGLEELPLGKWLGSGHTSHVFAHADDPDKLAIRVTYLREDAPAAAVDEFGETAMRTRIKSEHIRSVRIEKSYDVIADANGSSGVTRVMIVERVAETAEETIARQGGRMSVAQMMALDGALNDLNRQGLVWLDNKWDNFAFRPLNDGSGRVEIVVLDHGGIVPIRAGAGAANGESVADVARRVQLHVNGDYATQNPLFAWITVPGYRVSVRQATIQNEFADVFDYDALGIAGPHELHFNPRSGEDFDYFAPLFSAPD